MRGVRELMDSLKDRFTRNAALHPGISWARLELFLSKNSGAMSVVARMEASGGEPDLVKMGLAKGQWALCDCSAESPKGRRSLCYDSQALDGRKANKPHGSAVDMARDIGVELMGEAEYRALQGMGEFDQKTSSWVFCPDDVRRLGGAIFCDRRYGRVFTYHNGAESYYSSRGFRGLLWVKEI